MGRRDSVFMCVEDVTMKLTATARNSLAGLIAALALLIGGMIAMTQSHTEADSQAGTSGKPAAHVKADGGAEVRPFRVHFSDEALADLKRRVASTRWPDKEVVNDQSQGVQLSTVQKLANYWAKDYDWRKVEAKLNSYPQFTMTIDGVDIHFIHVRSKERNALPVIVTHGWPGSIIEQLKIIDPLTNPTAYGGTAADAFDVV